MSACLGAGLAPAAATFDRLGLLPAFFFFLLRPSGCLDDSWTRISKFKNLLLISSVHIIECVCCLLVLDLLKLLAWGEEDSGGQVP